MSKPGSESPKDDFVARLERIGIATDIKALPNRAEFVGIRDSTFAWSIVHAYVPPRGLIVFLERWEYPSYAAAKAALDAWTPGKPPGPQGWRRHVMGAQGERRSTVLKSIANGGKL